MGFFDLVRALISGAWRFFTETAFPGLPDVTFASLFVTVCLASLGLHLLSLSLGVFSGSLKPRSSSTKKPKISKERKNDTH